MDPCHCGFNGSPPDHPCHGLNYTCREPAKQRFYNAKTVALGGAQVKLGAADTWACDECWAHFQRLFPAINR
jgi:hypothetical protein